ncbi:hypothetical protein ASPWEDRAFT_300207 [Aspergillus wentii DTO 134E9]|uniref:Uncharacterized protein n=1 Tax=Aspergillus wentii DTO 134E9 TaxID=1073089 RepID=A0A1L9R4Y1_ASPWE|nr:uncharacterized protein ASPWEDRAFT_300207 [Aspergillus wentii DTO 134E9]OJJ29970.1 hypothetical protein ASPWEDRAFT_300207 [Aspergillus wentii DTO 134E9]
MKAVKTSSVEINPDVIGCLRLIECGECSRIEGEADQVTLWSERKNVRGNRGISGCSVWGVEVGERGMKTQLAELEEIYTASRISKKHDATASTPYTSRTLPAGIQNRCLMLPIGNEEKCRSTAHSHQSVRMIICHACRDQSLIGQPRKWPNLTLEPAKRSLWLRESDF